MEILWTNAARKALRRLPRLDQDRLRARVAAVAADPAGHHGFVTALTDRPGRFRVRAGDWRAVYSVDREAPLLTVHRVGHRRDIYRS